MAMVLKRFAKLKRNPSDYQARKKAKEEEEQEKSRVPRRTKSSVDSYDVTKRRSYTDRRSDDIKETRSKRRSLNFDQNSPGSPEGVQSPRKQAPDRPHRLPVRTNSAEGQTPTASERRQARNSRELPEKSGSSDISSPRVQSAVSPATSPTRSSKKTRAPAPPENVVEKSKSPVINEQETANASVINKKERSESPLINEQEKSKSPVIKVRERSKSPVIHKQETAKSQVVIQKESSETCVINEVETNKSSINTKQQQQQQQQQTDSSSAIPHIVDTSPSRPPRRKRTSSSTSPEATSPVFDGEKQLKLSLETETNIVSADSDDKCNDPVSEECFVSSASENVQCLPPVINTAKDFSPEVDEEVLIPAKKQEEKGDLGVDKILQLTSKLETTDNQTDKNLHVINKSGDADVDKEFLHKVQDHLNQSPKLHKSPGPSPNLTNRKLTEETFNRTFLKSRQKSPVGDFKIDSLSDSKYSTETEYEEEEIVEISVVAVSHGEYQRNIAPDRISLASVQSETDSIPPELPCSPPPILPATALHEKTVEEEGEVIEVVTSPRLEALPPKVYIGREVTLTKSDEIESQSENFPSKVNTREETLAKIDKIEPVYTELTFKNSDEIKSSSTESNIISESYTTEQTSPLMMSVDTTLIDEPVPQTNGALDVYYNDLTIEAKLKEIQNKDSDDSDVSDLEENNGQFEATFTPGEGQSGTVPVHVSVDGHGSEDDGIQLLSFNTNNSHLQSPGEQSTTDSAFDEMMSSMQSNDLDSVNQVGLSNTLDDFSDNIITETVEVVQVSHVEHAPESTIHDDEVKPETILLDLSEPELHEQTVEPDVSEEPPLPSKPAPELVKVGVVEPEPLIVRPTTESVVEEVSFTPVQSEHVEQSHDTPAVTETPKSSSAVKSSKVTFNLSASRTPSDGRNKSISQKAKEFSDIINEPPRFTIKASTKEVSKERLKEMDQSRKAIIKLSTRAADREAVSSSEGESEDEDNSKRGPTKGVQNQETWNPKSENPDEEPLTARQIAFGTKVSWEDKPDKVNLYSENFSPDTKNSEDVVTESIADLGSTRRHWEKFTKSPSQPITSTPKQQSAKKPVRHWEVKLPYKPSPATQQTPDKMEDSAESAIDREIRLANEREEMLKREQQERQELIERQLESKKQMQKSNFEKQSSINNNNEPVKPMYHEMTEADRGSELQQRENIIKQELEEQQEREQALQRAESSQEVDNSEVEDSTESIIAREIRVQQEREDELMKQNKEKLNQPSPRNKVIAKPDKVVETVIIAPVEEPSQEMAAEKDITYEEAIGTYQHEGESLIARELRETREREEELQRMREKLSSTKVSSPTPKQAVVQEQSVAKVTPKVTPKVTEPVRKPHQNSLSSSAKLPSHSPMRSMNVLMSPSPAVDTSPKTNGTVIPERKETPIEREIRIARERENEFRRQKGLPEIPIEKNVEVVEDNFVAEDEPVVNNYYRKKQSGKSDKMLQKMSSSRLQNELMKQRERELSLRKEGKIISTSEDHIEPLTRYAEVTGADKTESPVKRNFVTRRSISSLSDNERTPSEHSDNESLKDTVVTVPPPQVSKEEPKFRRAISSGGPTFSFRESSQKAESMIERELREMREREEELRTQRAAAGSSGATSPR